MTANNNGLSQVGWTCKLKGSDGPWALITFEEHARCKGHPTLEFKPVYELVDDSKHKVSSDKTAAVSLVNEFLPMADAPLGVKVQCLNVGNVAIYATVTSTTRHHFKGWYPVPKIPTTMR